VTHPSLPRDRRVEANFSESAETAAAVSQLEVKPWRWLHDPRMVYGEYDAGRCCQKHQPCLIRLVLGPIWRLILFYWAFFETVAKTVWMRFMDEVYGSLACDGHRCCAFLFVLAGFYVQKQNAHFT